MFILKYLKPWFKLAAWKQILIALGLGIITGLLLGPKAAWLLPIGTVFIHSIQMLVAPVVATAVICAVLSLNNLDKMGRIAFKALIVYAISMAAAASIGIFIANAFHVGYGLINHMVGVAPQAHELHFSEVLVGLVPLSPFLALASNNVLQILCFSILFGIALKMVGEEAMPVQKLFFSLSKVVFQLAKIVVGFAPYGIFALIADVFGEYGLAALWPLIKLIGAVYFSCFLLMFLGYSSVLILNRLSPLRFFKNIINPLVMAYTTSSSAATLPITMRCAQENLHINPEISNFLLPLGTTFNLNGLSIYLSVAAIFSAHIFGITLGLHQYIFLVITIVLTAAGAAAVPGSALIVMGAVMGSVGIPLGAIPLIAGVDRFNDMAQTMTNVAGDLLATILVAKSEKEVEKIPS